MAKRDSDQRNKSSTKWQHKQQYWKLCEDLREWFHLHEEDKLYLSMATLQKYKVILKSLRQDFKGNSDMAEYINKLPSAWILTPWLIEIMIVICMIIFYVTNQLFLKIYTGILINPRGIGKSDLIYLIVPLILAFMYFLLLYIRMLTYDSLKKNLSRLWGLARKQI